MMNRFFVEALDQTWQDIMVSQNKDNTIKPFNINVVAFGNDFKIDFDCD